MTREKTNEESLRNIVREIIDYVFQNKEKFVVFDGSVIKLTNREIRRVIESKYGPDTWNHLSHSVKFYDILKRELHHMNYIVIRRPQKTGTGRWRLYIIPSDKTSKFIHLLR